MPRGGRFWFGVAKLAIWTISVLLFFRVLGLMVGGNFREYWVLIAAASTVFISFLVNLLKRFNLPGDPENKQPTPSADASMVNALTVMGDGTCMPDNPNVEHKTLHINHGTSYHNTPGGMMNFGPVTVHQNFGDGQANPESAQEEPREKAVEVVADDETIDINSLVDLSANIKSPGVSRNTVDNILKKAGIKPCATEKDGKTIRYLYPRKESLSAIAGYLADKNK